MFQIGAFQSNAFQIGGGGVAPTPAPPPAQTPAGAPRRRRRYLIEIDKELFEVRSEEEAYQILGQLKAEAENQAKLVLERSKRAIHRPTRKILQDTRKALKPPEINAPDFSQYAQAILDQIQDLYKSTFLTIEIWARLREDDDDDILLLL